MPPRWDDDDRLFADLTDALRDEDAEVELRRQAEGAFTWRTIDSDLAALTYDSLLDDGVHVRARSRAARRTLVFEHGSVRVELEMTPEGIVGQLVPPSVGSVAVIGTGGVLEETEADEIGSFVLDTPIAGPVRLRVRAGQTDLVTDWIGL